MKTTLLLFVACLFAACTVDKTEVPEEVPQTRSAESETELYTFGSGITVEKKDSLYIFQGDIILSEEQIAEFENPKLRGAASIEMKNNYWPNGVVYYDYSSDYFWAYNKKYVEAAMRAIESVCAVRFIEKTTDVPTHIRFVLTRDGVGSSYIGMLSGVVQFVTIPMGYDDSQTDIDIAVSLAIHEICHALGMHHEHSRADRDNYVNIYENNIKAGFASQFATYIHSNERAIDLLAYDYTSIMHYSSNECSKNPEVLSTILKKNGSEIPRNTKLSDRDGITLQMMYGPPYIEKRSVITSDNSWWSGLTRVVDTKSDAYIDFFSDQARTQKTSLGRRRLVKIRIDTWTAPNNKLEPTYETLVINPDRLNDIYKIGEQYCYMRWINANLFEHRERTITVLN